MKFKTYLFRPPFSNFPTNEKDCSRPVAPRLFPVHRSDSVRYRFSITHFLSKNFGSHARASVDARRLLKAFRATRRNDRNHVKKEAF